MKYLIKYESFNVNLKDRFKVGEYVIMLPFNNMKLKIKEIKDNTLLLVDNDGHLSEWKPNGIIPEIEFQSKKYNL